MTDKVQKIRERVEKLKSQLLRGACSSQIAMETRCKEEAYNEVLAILDTMQEEPTGNPLGSTHAEFRTAVESLGISQEEHDRIVDECIYGKEPELVDVDDLPKEEPASEIDYEQELYKAFGQVKDFTLGMRIAKWFYDMGKNNQEHVSEDLEEASKEWLRPQLDKSYANYGEAKMMELTHFDGYAMLDAIEFGAQWKEEHLWKPADGDNLPEIDREVIVLTQPYPLENSEYAVSFAHRPNPDGWDGKSLSTGKVEHYTPKTYDKGGWNIPDIVYWLDIKLPKEIEL